MVNHEVILRKVTKLKEYVNELRQADDISWEKYQRSIRDRAFVERYIHFAIQTVFDIANHIISYQGWEEPETYREIFTILASNGVFPDEKLSDYQNMASFRNILVHHYEKVEDEVVFGIFKNKLEDFDLFQKFVLAYLRKDKSAPERNNEA
ncbi:MAG: DUF86 domain-containing protein [Thermoplasmatales archaeon]|nr:DUF86 domain-containing protein [Thermoplasmatales archaeon]